MATKIERSRLREALVEMADDMRRLGIIDDAKHRKIAMGAVGEVTLQTIEAPQAKGDQRD